MGWEANISNRLIASALVAGLGFASSWFLIRLILARVRLWNAKIERSFHHTHTESVPRYGGLALAGAFVLVLALIAGLIGMQPNKAGEHLVIALGALAFFGLGFLDDIKPLGAKKKLAAQIVIAGLVYLGGLQISNFRVPGFEETHSLGTWLGVILTIAWFVGIPNLINLIDGTDGLAGGVALMLMCLLSHVAWHGHEGVGALIALGMSGALLGFLRFNFPPARIYMGDGGAYLLGFLIAALALQSSQKGTVAAALLAPLVALALPIIDMAFAVARRALVGLPVFRADQKHIHHQLRNRGLSRTKTVLTLYGASLAFLILAFVAFWLQGKFLSIVLGLLLLVAVIGARSFGLVTGWAALGRTLGTSPELRQEVQYALPLLRWLELEAQRSRSPAELWADFTFVVEKLGFSAVRLSMGDDQRDWSASEPRLGVPLVAVHELRLNGAVSLRFEAGAEAVDATVFDLLSELSAEAWLKALKAWQRVHSSPFAFSNEPCPPMESPARVRAARLTETGGILSTPPNALPVTGAHRP